MKLTKIGAALVLTFGMSAAAMASNTITFNGEVLETGCTITVDGGTPDATVELGSVAATDLVAKVTSARRNSSFLIWTSARLRPMSILSSLRRLTRWLVMTRTSRILPLGLASLLHKTLPFN